ncbi:MAG: hypothetical protein LZF86_250052 [Nitrospira sp.]|nr:MAG: hypothetical protein LZF86_250052 [Nitrospira sp.]
MAPDRVQVPVPDLLIPPAPDNTPLKLVLVLILPVLSVPLPSEMLPAPATEPTALLKLFKSHVAPDATVTAEKRGTTSVAPLRSMPACTMVLPA